MRGLKHNQKQQNFAPIVASFTDAWIETVNMNESILMSEVASFTDAWIETYT